MVCWQAAGKSAEAVERLILGPAGSPIEMVMAQSTGGSTRTVRMARCPHLQRPTASGSDNSTSTKTAQAAGGDGRRQARQQIVPTARLPAAAWSEKRQASKALGSTQVGLMVTCEDLDASLDYAGFWGEGCGLRIRSIFQDLSVGRFEKVEVGVSRLASRLLFVADCSAFSLTWLLSVAVSRPPPLLPAPPTTSPLLPLPLY
jgi:hypothetical protein